MLAAGDLQIRRLRAGSDHDRALCLESGSTDRKSRRSGETRDALKGFNAGPPQCRLSLFRHRIREGALESHQVWPVDGQTVRTDAFAIERQGGVERCGGADE